MIKKAEFLYKFNKVLTNIPKVPRSQRVKTAAQAAGSIFLDGEGNKDVAFSVFLYKKTK